ncbi:serine/threonine-protein kinase [Tautonia marina]|uniref:serine/threonine-protein kinase n=1 Tax=Tautonia marina TaxID=2653855 RepID=UPI0012608DFA|nr:serine/threonine-protein kinase [Tautonia marina]
MIEPTRPSDLATSSGRTWDDASSPAAARIVRRFEDDWRRSPPDARPDPRAYLPDDPTEQPGAWLALLRADLGLRWDAGEAVRVEQYRARYPDLDEQTLVALLYEEFCLFEETGSNPDPTDYERRFPELASALRRVFDIHALIGGSASPMVGSTQSNFNSGRSTRSAEAAAVDSVEFPEAGETIGGFRLAEELGRGSFARVYLAHERLLADRPVALKVATTGSREPQTLARLQHTHIVPVHSYRVDPVTGLHLLCMPFFGRTTLADVLSDPATLAARSGSDLLAVLDRVEPPEDDRPRASTAARKALTGRSFSGAIAWWGARLAEALQHAHDRGVLHRDVKPTNVLVTGDGLPMLLDFNLAISPILDESENDSAKLGGTLAYMAPEHIEGLAEGIDTGVDARADVFALGVVLFEAIAGTRPFPVVRQARSVPEAFWKTAEQRRAGAPPLQRGGRPVSPALEAVIRRSLEPDVERRYQSAAELAADLQAIANDGPLRHATEPIASRSLRWLRRNRVRFVMAAPAVVAGSILLATVHDARVRRVAAQGEVRRVIEQAEMYQQAGKLDAAIQGYGFAMQAAAKHPSLAKLWWEAQEKRLWAIHIEQLERHTIEFFEEAEWLRYRLFGFVEPERPPGDALRGLLSPFGVFSEIDWAANDDFDRLQPERRRRLLEAVPQLLFLRAVHLWLTEPAGAAPTVEIADLRDRAVRAMPIDDPRRAAWDALCRELGILRPAIAPASGQTLSARERARQTAEAAFLLGIASAARYQGTRAPADASRAITWLEAAVRGRPDAYWPRFYLATFALESGRINDALRHADAAVALNPSTPWALFNRALAARASGNTATALGDLRAASARIPSGDRDRLRDRIELNVGLVLLQRGDRAGARAAFESIVGEAPVGLALGRLGTDLLLASGTSGVASGLGSAGTQTAIGAIAASSGTRFERAARLDLARLDAEAGRPALALLTYSDLLVNEPAQREARLGRALILLASGEQQKALADAESLVAQARAFQDRTLATVSWADRRPLAELLEFRGRCLLATEQPTAALADFAESLAMAPTPARSRLHLRALLATRPGGSLRLDDPSVLDLLPGPGLADDLRDAAEALASPPASAEASPVPRMLTRATVLAGLGETEEAETVASEAALIAPDASLPRLVRARIRHRSGDLAGALADLDAALALRPNDLASLILRGQVLCESGRPLDAMNDLNRASVLGRDDASLHRARALALAAIGHLDAAIADLSEALTRDPHDPILSLLRARLHRRAGQPAAARADLDHALAWSTDRPELRALIAWTRRLRPLADENTPDGLRGAEELTTVTRSR